MPKQKKHPERLENVSEVRLNEVDRTAFVSEMTENVRKAINDRNSWELNLERWYKKRYGVRPATKNFPWPGASNIHVALVEEKIRKLKPNFLNIAFEGDPIVSMYPVGGTPIEAAQNSEIFLDWLLKYYMNRVPGKNYFESLSILTDWMLEKGFSVGKVVWEYQSRSYTYVIDVESLSEDIRAVLESPLTTDEEVTQLIYQQTGYSQDDELAAERIAEAIKRWRAGDRYIKIVLEEECYNGPRVIAIDPKDLIVPDDTTDVETAREITHRMWLTVNELRNAEHEGKYENVDDATMDKSPASHRDIDTIDSTKARREGITRQLKDTDLVEIWEIFCWYDLNGDGVKEKCVLTLAADTETVLRFIEYPYAHGKWPFVVFRYELNDDRWYSARGIPELLDHYQTIVTNQENAKLDYMTLANSLQFVYRVGAVNPANIRFIPGQGIPLQRLEDLQQLQIQRLDISFDNEMSKIRQLSEALIGQPDMALGNLQNPQERRTAAEVNEAVALSKQVFSLDARTFKNALQKLYDQIFDLWLQYGPEQVWVAVTGAAPVQLTRSQIQGDYVIVPNGEFTTLSRTVEIQRDFATLQLALGDTSGALNTYEAWRQYLLKSNPRGAKTIMNPPEVYQQIQQQQQQMQALEFAKKMAIAGRTPAPTAQPGEGQVA